MERNKSSIHKLSCYTQIDIVCLNMQMEGLSFSAFYSVIFSFNLCPLSKKGKTRPFRSGHLSNL